MERPSVLVVDDRPNWLNMARTLLGEDFEVATANDYEAAIACLQKQRPPFHVLITDIRLNEGDPSDTRGLDVAQYAQELGGYTQTIVWTAYPSIETAKQAFRNLGSVDYIVKDQFQEEQFVAKVHEAAEAARQRRWENRVLLVDDSHDWQDKLSDLLNQAGCSTDVEESYSGALRRIGERSYRLLVTEIKLGSAGEQEGLDFIGQVKVASPETKVIIVSDVGARNTVRLAFTKLGVVDFLSKTEGEFDPDSFVRSVRETYMPSRELFVVADFKNLMLTDPLEVDKEYIFLLSGRETVLRQDRAVSIWLPPSRESIEVEVVLYVDGEAEILPTASQIWTITTKGKTQDVYFSVIPRQAGRLIVQVELFGETGWWKRLEQVRFVKNGQSQSS